MCVILHRLEAEDDERYVPQPDCAKASMLWCGVHVCGMVSAVWCVVRCGVVRCDVVRCDVV